MIEVVHLTAHLGGGVGKALSELVMATNASNTPVRHVFACLERPEKSGFLEKIKQHGGEVLIEPDLSQLTSRLENADVVQLEWWNHPATIGTLCRLPALPMRMIIWCHVSGLSNPIIPKKLVEAPQRFIMSSECSKAATNIAQVMAADPEQIHVISSAGGMDALPKIKRSLNLPTKQLSVGYLGSLNFSKLHPDFVSWLASVHLPNFQLRLIGDPINREALSAQAAATGRPDLFEFKGYTTDVASELAALDVMVYLLNPRHYGTAENALVEAMAMGVVPVVLDNPAERCIVDDGATGIVLSTGEKLAEALEHLASNPEYRYQLSESAANEVRRKFTSARMAEAFYEQYNFLLTTTPRSIKFKNIFGEKPADWFLACQSEAALYSVDSTSNCLEKKRLSIDAFERNKGSLFHFQRSFPEDPRLTNWIIELKKHQC